MRALRVRIKEQWPLSIVVLVVLVLGYAGWWPAIPLPYQPPQAKPTASGQGQIVEWLMSLDLQDSLKVFPSPLDPEYCQVPSSSLEERVLVSQPQLVRHEGNLVVSWAIHPSAVDGVGQWIGGAWSEDGQIWHTFPNMFRSPSDQRDMVPGNIILLPAAFQAVEERLFALAHVYEVAGFGTPNAVNFAKPETSQPTAIFSKPVLESRGYLVRELRSGMKLGPVWWFGGQRPTQNLIDFEASAVESEIAATLTARFQAAASRPANDAEFAEPQISSADGSLLSWPTTLNWADDLNYRLWTVADSLEPLYMQLSIDQGKSWSSAQPTNVPNAGSRAMLGRIKDGPVFLIGNQSHATRPEAADTLTISMAFEWLQFAHSYTIRTAGASPRSRGAFTPRSANVLEKIQNRHWGIQVSSWMLDDHSLWVAYSMNSEAIELCRIPIASLAPVASETAEDP